MGFGSISLSVDLGLATIPRIRIVSPSGAYGVWYLVENGVWSTYLSARLAL